MTFRIKTTEIHHCTYEVEASSLAEARTLMAANKAQLISGRFATKHDDQSTWVVEPFVLNADSRRLSA